MTTWLWPNSTVTRVVDGDSIEAKVTRMVDLGFRQTQATTFPVKLRLNRINTPPANTAAGRDATARVRELAVGPLLIETLRLYKYGGGEIPEWMAEVTLPDGRNLSDVLVAEGLALHWDGTGPRPGG